MSRTRRILSNFSVVNILLAAVLIVFANAMLLPLFGKSSQLTVPSAKKQTAVPSKTAEKPAESKSPSPSDYFLIAEQNIFHPERKIPVEKKDVAVAPLPKPEFVLYGTLIVDDLRVAYMEDRKAPQNAPTRGKKQIPLRPGEALSGFVLKEMDADKVVMVRGEEKLVVSLNDPSKSKTRESGVTVSPAAQAATLASPQQRSPQPAAGAAAAQRANPQPTPQTTPLRTLFRRNRASNYNAE